MKYVPNKINILDISLENSIKFNPNENNSKLRYSEDIYNSENEEMLLNNKQMLNINTLQSIRISHSIDNSEESKSLIDTSNGDKTVNINNHIKNDENDMNINNRGEEKSKKNNFIYIDNEDNYSKNEDKKTTKTVTTQNKETNNFFDNFKIEEIFKERFEEKTKSYKIFNKKENGLEENNNNIFRFKEKKPQTLKYLNYFQINKKSINNKNKNNQLRSKDSLSLEQDSIELDDKKTAKLVIDTFDIKNISDDGDKNILISELDYDISNSSQNNIDKGIKQKSNKKEKIIKKSYVGEKQKKIGVKNNITKKIYPIKKINLNNNKFKKNEIQTKYKLNNYKDKNFGSSSTNNIQKRITNKNQVYKQSLNNSNKSSYKILNTSINVLKNQISEKFHHTIQRKFSYRPKYPTKNILNENTISLKKYYRITPIYKLINNKTKLYDYNIKNITNRNNNALKKIINETAFNSNSSINNINKISNQNTYKKNNSFIIKRNNNLNNIDKTFKKKFNIPKSHYNKINGKNKIPIKKNANLINQKMNLYTNNILNNNKIANKINTINNSIFHSNSYYGKKEDNFSRLKNDNNYINLKMKKINQSPFVLENRGKNRIIINTIYNSLTNNIISFPCKPNFSKNKIYKYKDKEKALNYLEQPFILMTNVNESNKKNKNIMNSNKSRDIFNLLTEYTLNIDKTINYSKKKSKQKKIKKKVINHEIKNKNYFRNNKLIFNNSKNKENKNKQNLTRNDSKNKYFSKSNNSIILYKSSNNSSKKEKLI